MYLDIQHKTMKNKNSPRNFDESKYDNALLKIEQEGGPMEPESAPDLSKIDDSKKFKTKIFVNKDILERLFPPQAE